MNEPETTKLIYTATVEVPAAVAKRLLRDKGVGFVQYVDVDDWSYKVNAVGQWDYADD
jgi:hypothetical protein